MRVGSAVPSLEMVEQVVPENIGAEKVSEEGRSCLVSSTARKTWRRKKEV